MNNTVHEAPPVPFSVETEPGFEPDLDAIQDGVKLETALQLYALEISRALELNETLLSDEQLAHDINGFELYWQYVLEQLGPDAVQEMNRTADFFEYLREKARESYERLQVEHESRCEKTYESAREKVEQDMVLDEDELRDESLFHEGEEKLRTYLLRKIRDLKKQLNNATYERLNREVIEPLLDQRVREYQEKHQSTCEKTYENAKDRVKNDMVLEPHEQQDNALFEQGEGALRALLMRKIRDLKKQLESEMYARLEEEVIVPLLFERVAEYMESYEERKHVLEEELKDDEPKEEEMQKEEVEEGEPEIFEEEAVVEEPVVDSSENRGEGRAKMQQEAAVTTRDQGEGGESVQADNVQSGEVTVSTESVAQGGGQEHSMGHEAVISEISISSEVNVSTAKGESAVFSPQNPDPPQKKAESSTVPLRKVEKEEKKAEAEVPNNLPFVDLQGVKQLLLKGEVFFQPFLAEWAKSMDSAQYRKAAHEIGTKAKTAKAFVLWLLAPEQSGRLCLLQKKHASAWEKFRQGLKIFGFWNFKSETETQPKTETVPEADDTVKKQEEADKFFAEEDAEPLAPLKFFEEPPEEKVAVATEENKTHIQDVEEETEEPCADLSEELPDDPEDQEVISSPEQQYEPHEEEEESFAPDGEYADIPLVPEEIEEETEEDVSFLSYSPSDGADMKEEVVLHEKETDFFERPFPDYLEEEGEEEQAIESFDVEASLVLLEQDELLEPLDYLEESLWEMTDDAMTDIEDEELRDGYAEDLKELDRFFRLIVEEDINDDESAPDTSQARQFIGLLMVLAREYVDDDVKAEKISLPNVFWILAEELGGSEKVDVERKIMTIVRHYPQFRFLLLLLLRKLYLELNDQQYVRLMMLLYQEQYGATVMGVRELAEMLVRFVHFLGKPVNGEYCLHPVLDDYDVLNARELFSYLSGELCSFSEHVHHVQFVSQPSHCHFESFPGRGRALLSMNMEGIHACQRAVGFCWLKIGINSRFEIV